MLFLHNDYVQAHCALSIVEYTGKYVQICGDIVKSVDKAGKERFHRRKRNVSV